MGGMAATSRHGGAHYLAHHHGGVAVKESNAGKALTVLEGVHNQRLAGLEHNG
eukprot:CAMPEP_0117660738 /NCGR_PEP_ID=MMETSP0804-20121206/7127_1 /TAXON_ID=1074897 /ORGANISM="Tetraselmis astigmatica, Strain CCMP880" /LENGTH=52 /DNA_ID=CAMNT_0005467485 /DNA_START=72 /DNA_END=226 /DNA_ORIENTATION=+